ncbi:hypothetical protein HJC23_007582 [Cyclotella cryptica]|uniref:Uncharacterized protein n=1 Tax=Cyclotella cryptica TaxID=29204 RepID=A0ABD3QRE6_9STRA
MPMPLSFPVRLPVVLPPRYGPPGTPYGFTRPILVCARVVGVDALRVDEVYAWGQISHGIFPKERLLLGLRTPNGLPVEERLQILWSFDGMVFSSVGCGVSVVPSFPSPCRRRGVSFCSDVSGSCDAVNVREAKRRCCWPRVRARGVAAAVGSVAGSGKDPTVGGVHQVRIFIKAFCCRDPDGACRGLYGLRNRRWSGVDAARGLEVGERGSLREPPNAMLMVAMAAVPGHTSVHHPKLENSSHRAAQSRRNHYDIVPYHIHRV